MISLASSFQRRQPHPVSITLAPINRRRTFAYAKFLQTFRRPFPAKQCTSIANEHHHGVYLVELNALVWWIARLRCQLHHLPQIWRVLPRRQRLLSLSCESFCHQRSSLAEGEHTIAFALSIPFRFAVPVRVWRSSPSNPCFPFLSVLFRSTSMDGSSRALCLSVRMAHAWLLQRTPSCQPCMPPKPTPHCLAPSKGRAAGV
jgi:hypothetical protein